MSTAIVTFDYHSTNLLFDRDTNTGDLTALWRAVGSPENKAPRFWVRNDQAQEIIAALARRENVSQDHLFFVRQGRNGGTWAHWQIALIYAHYLSPDLYLAWNEFTRACIEGAMQPTNIEGFTAAEVKVLRHIAAREMQKRMEPEMRKALPSPLTEMQIARQQRVLDVIIARGGAARLIEIGRDIYGNVGGQEKSIVHRVLARLINDGKVKQDGFRGPYVVTSEV
jgi:hypothetical protein